MATQTNITLIDDIDGTEAVDTIQFAVGSATYELDLNEKHLTSFNKALATYIAAARRLNVRGKPTKNTKVGPSSSAVRAWAEANGIDVSPRGRIPGSVIEQYEAAGN